MLATKIGIQVTPPSEKDSVDVNINLHSTLPVGTRLYLASEMRKLLEHRDSDRVIASFVSDTEYAKLFLSLMSSRKEAEDFILKLMSYKSNVDYASLNAVSSENGQTSETQSKNKWV
jgi:hypothetical protein